jgi:fumarate hydratase subunit beta
MTEHYLTLPPTREMVDAIRVGDIVYLTGDIVVTGGLPAHKRLVEYLDQGKALPVEIEGAFIHLPHMVEERADGGWDIHYVNPTTSTRFDSFMPRFIRELGLHIVGGKGGLGAGAVAAMQEVGCIYVSLLGGGSAILSDCIKEVRQVEWRDFPAHFRLSRLRVEKLGPLTVGIDAHGGSIYETLTEQARDRMPDILAQLDRRRAEAMTG